MAVTLFANFCGLYPGFVPGYKCVLSICYLRKALTEKLNIDKQQGMKMYIIVKDDIPDKLVPVITAHASLACYKKFEANDEMIKWVTGIFKKVVCLANETEFDKLKNETDFVLLTESSLNNREVCLAFCPREEYSKRFKFLKMWTPQNIQHGKSGL